jgi:ubiquinone biosynthesis protein COQ9
MQQQDIRDDILAAALAHAAFDGWSERTLRAAAADLGLSADAAIRAFPEGAVQLVRYWSEQSDRRMLEELEKRDLSSMRMRDRVAAGVRIRIEINAPHREAVRRALVVLGLPHNADVAARCTYDTVNAIWYAAGDASTDYNFYTKRALLAGVYAATVLYWLEDKSDQWVETWAFLDRRLDDAMKLPTLPSRFTKLFAGLASPLAGIRPRTRRNFRARR